MATIPLINAKLYWAGYDVSGDFNQMTLNYSAEALDATVFGMTTKVMQGGLKVSSLTGGGLWQAGANKIDQELFDSLPADDAVVMVFPDAFSEGATSTGSGYMFKATEARYQLGGPVGQLLPFTVEIKSRGAGGVQA